MPHFAIKHRWTDDAPFEGDFDTMRLCVEAAHKAHAYLAGASLARANLAGANLAGAIWRPGFTLKRAPVRTAQRADGFTFYLLDTDKGWRISAGCRFFTPEEAWQHWEHTRPDDTGLGGETRDILTMFELAMERGA